ncbi:MAG: class I SAM-dependent methyltransferase [Magnetospirillum sp. WYHS-4]
MENSADRPPRAGHLAISEPSAWVRRFAPLVRAGGSVLDLACGGGRHARFFAGRGHPVLAIDRDTAPVADLAGPAVEILSHDMEDGGPWPLEGLTFAAVVVVNYLHRPLFPFLRAAVAPGGVLIYETFARGNERYSRPRNPAHLLEEGELLRLAGDGLSVVAFEQGIVERVPCPGVVQRLCAVAARPDPQPLYPPTLP